MFVIIPNFSFRSVIEHIKKAHNILEGAVKYLKCQHIGCKFKTIKQDKLSQHYAEADHMWKESRWIDVSWNYNSPRTVKHVDCLMMTVLIIQFGRFTTTYSILSSLIPLLILTKTNMIVNDQNYGENFQYPIVWHLDAEWKHCFIKPDCNYCDQVTY